MSAGRLLPRLGLPSLAVLLLLACDALGQVPPQDAAYLLGTGYSPNGQYGGIHTIPHLNDGIYGNNNSWIPPIPSSPPWTAGITFPLPFRVDAVAFGRDNTGAYGDREASNFTIQGQLLGGGFSTQRTVTGRTTPTRVQYDFFRTGTPGTDQVFVADDVRVVTTATNNGSEVCIDELEVYGRPAVVPPYIAGAPLSNLAVRPGAQAFASSVLSGYAAHTIPHLNDAVYGNSNSWIPATAGTEWGGVSFNGPVRVQSIAFGRDNTDTYTDRVAPTSTLQYTTALTTNYNDPGVVWTTIGAVNRNYAPGGGAVRVNFAGRMQYDLAAPVYATAVRVLSNGTQVCIDELEALGLTGPSTVPTDDIALRGTAYASSVLPGYAAHTIPHLNDGVYGNSNSWISNEVNDGTAGVQLDKAYRIDAVAFGRDNTGALTDRVPRDFTIESSLAGGPFAVQQTTTGRTYAQRFQYDFLNGPGSGQISTFAADRVQVNISAVNGGNQPCIDELEIYGRPASVADGKAPASNLARRPEADPFASSVVGGYPDRHTVGGLTDGVYGNMNSWIPADAGSEFFGSSLGRLVQVQSVAFGRDNTDFYKDRVAPSYTIQYTTVATNNYNDPTIPWTTAMVVDRNYAPGFGAVRANFAGRMQYTLPTPVQATAVRVLAAGQPAIDELEILGVAPPSDDIATRGVAYASSALPGYAFHQIPHLNDGMYGNEHSWISNQPNAGTAGIQLDGAYRIDAVAFGRDNGGEATANGDRQASNFTIESSLGGGPFTTRQTVAGRTTPTRVQYDFINGGGSGQISTWEADRVQVNISAVNGGAEPCIDELEVYGRPASVMGYDAASTSGNLALRPGATAMASSVLSGYAAHTIPHLTDGVYGNANSWIPAGGGAEWGGVNFGGAGPVVVNAVAFGRDNTDFYKDRVVSSYNIEYTLDDPADPNARWRTRTVATRDYSPGGGTVRPLFSGRMEYDVGQMPARGVRISVTSGQPAIDELEAIGSAPAPNVSFQYLRDSTAVASSEHGSGLFPARYLNDGIQGTSSGSPARYWNDNTQYVAGDWAAVLWDETQQVRYVNLRMPLTEYDLPTSTVPGVKVQYLRPGGNAADNNDWLDYDAPRTLIAPNAAGSNPNPNNYYDHAPLITKGIRAYFTSTGNDDGWNFLEEIEAYGSPNIARMVGTPFASSQHSSGLYPAAALNDGLQGGGGYWNDGTQGAYPDYAGILFDEPMYVDGVNLRTPVLAPHAANQRVIDDVSIQYLVLGGDPNNQSDWQTLVAPMTLVAPTLNDGSQNNFFSFDPLATAGIRAYFGPGSGNSDGWNYLDEIEVFGQVPEPGSATLVLVALGGLAALALRRRKR